MTDDAVERIVTAIAKYEAQKIGLPANQKSIAFFSSLVDRTKILPMCQFLRDSPSRNPDQVVARFAGLYDDGSWLIEDIDSAPQQAPTTQVVPSDQEPDPVLPPPAPLLGTIVDAADPEPEPDPSADPAPVSPVIRAERVLSEVSSSDSAPRVFDMSEQKGPLPVTLDNHTQLVIGSGLFRTLNKNLINNPALRPVLDSKTIYEVNPRFMHGYKAMTLAGPVLDTDFDIKSYLSLVKLLGSMTDEQYERAAASYIEVTPEQFYSPLAEFLSPAEFGDYIRDFMRTDKILHSMQRLHSFQMTLYKRPEDAEGHRGKESARMKDSVMIVGLVSVITLNGDGIIRITPNLPMREMYRAASRLIAVNRSTIIGFEHPISRIFSLWLTTLGNGQFKQDWVYINKQLTVRSILEGIHPLTEGGYYKKRHVKMLENALIELVVCGVLECAFRRHTDKQFTVVSAENCKAFSLDGLKVEIDLIRHRISHKQSPHDSRMEVEGEHSAQLPHDTRGTQEEQHDELSATTAVTLSNEIAHILKSVDFGRARYLTMPEMVELYRADMEKVAVRTKRLRKVDAALCRKTMKSVLGYRRERLANLFNAALGGPDKVVMAEVCAEFWGATTSSNENRLYDLLSTMPRESQIKDPDQWAITYAAQIRDFLALMVTEEGEAMLKGIRAAMLNARLINLLTKASLTKEAKLVKYRAEAAR